MKNERILVVLTLFALAASVVQAQTSAFTYQGSLNDNSSEASGTYQMKFSLFDTPSAGSQIGQTIEVTSVNVISGRFTAKLDFGAGAFDGSERFLQIEVRRNAGESYIALSPRQELTSAPYAVKAAVAQDAETLAGVPGSNYAEDSEIVRNGTITQSGANFNIGGTGRANVFDSSTDFRILGRRMLSMPGSFSNLVIGDGAGNSINGAVQTTLVGTGAGQNLTSGNANSFLGFNSGFSNTTGFNNTFVGNGAGFANTTAEDNVFVGTSAGADNNGPDNVFVGRSAGANNTTGRENTFIGRSAGLANNVGIENVFVGAFSGDANTSGNSNTFVGEAAGTQNTNGVGNTFLGRNSGFGTTTGGSNTFVGSSAGGNNTTGNNNTLIGDDAEVIGNNLSFATAIGSDSRVSTSNTIVLGRAADRTVVSGELSVLAGETSPVDRGEVNLLTGSGNFDLYMQGGGGARGINFGVDSGPAAGAKLFISQYDGTTYADRLRINENGTIWVGVLGGAGSTDVCQNTNNELSTCSSSIRYKDNVESFSSGADVLRRLRPVTFAWKDSGVLDLGLVAEEVAEIQPLLVTYNRDGAVEGVKYDRLGVVLVNVVKEQQKTIEEQGSKLKVQSEQIGRIEAELDTLKAVVCSANGDAEACK